MTTEVPQKFIDILSGHVVADPGLPRSKPTTSYWQLPPHKSLANIQSTALQETTDYAIIGSGVTGCSIANALLERADTNSSKVTVFEARSLCSGASGRNGGGMASHVPYIFSYLVDKLGKDKAIEIAKFTYQTLDKMHQLANSTPDLKDASEVRRTRDVTGFLDVETFESTKESFRLMEELAPETNVQLEVFDPEAFSEEFGVNTVGGGLRFNCGAFWPYRFVTTFWEKLCQQYGEQIRIETNTAVLEISCEADSEHPYLLKTNRGTVRARKLFHATNGYTGHLLPEMRGKVFPMIGFMSAQKPGSAFTFKGDDKTWSFFGSKSLDVDTGVQETGVYYGQRTQESGDIMWGSDKIPIDQWLNADDDKVPQASHDDLSSALPKLFPSAWAEGERPEVRELWSGVQGYTADHMPVVGKLPASSTGRGQADGEYIAAGFNGAGMCQCWSSGEAVVKMAFGEDVSSILPSAYVVSEARLSRSTMSAQAAVEAMTGGELSH